MPHFYLDVCNTQADSPDEQGREFADLEAARADAIAGIRSILRDEVLEGRMDLNGEVRILDADRRLVMIVPYAEAVSIVEPDEAETSILRSSK